MRAHVMTLAGALLLGGGALAQGMPEVDTKTEQVVQESFVGNVAQTQQEQSLQVMTGADLRPQDDEAALRTPLRVQYGITDRLQLGADVEMGFFTGRGAQLGEVEPEASYAIVDSRNQGLSVVGALRAALPIGGLAQQESFAVVPNLGLYKRFSPVAVNLRVGAQLPVGTTRDELSGLQRQQGVAPEGSATVLWAQEGLFHPLVEVRAEGGDQPEARLAAGTMLTFAESWQAGVAYSLTRQPGASVSGAFATLTWQSQ